LWHLAHGFARFGVNEQRAPWYRVSFAYERHADLSLADERATGHRADHLASLVDYWLAMLAAILEKRVGLPFYDRDIYLNVVGGLKLAEPGVDLAVTLALASSHLDRPLPPQTVVFGEVGLTGEIRPVSQAALRLKEAAKLGFHKAYLPKGNLEGLQNNGPIQLLAVTNLQEMLEMVF
jgi:predicted ATP-dependent serine protease